MKLGGVLLDQLRWIAATGLQTPRTGTLRKGGNEDFDCKVGRNEDSTT
jgi:hypothetical protein